MSDNCIEETEESKNFAVTSALADLKRSGLTADHADTLGITYHSREETKAICGLDYPSYKIPYDNIFRLRLLSRPGTGFASVSTPPIRYWQEKDTPPQLYTVRGFDYEAHDTLVVTEGEKKAAAACLLKGIPTVGIGGVWSFMSSKLGIRLLPDLQSRLGNLTKYEIVPDGDFQSNYKVRQAVMAHAEVILSIRADLDVILVELPDDGDAKVGLDDYLLLPDADYASLPRKKITKMDVAAEKNWEKSDDGFAKAARFVFDDLKYIEETGQWVEFTKKGWKHGNDYSARRRLGQLRLARIAVAEEIEDDKARKAEIMYLTSCGMMRSSQNILNAWKEHPSMLSSIGAWDQDGLLLGTTNGIIDLTDGSLRQFKVDDRVTLRSRVNYDPSAQCPIWLTTLNEIFQGNQEIIDFLQRYYGYTLTGSTSEQKFMIQVGRGRNGKSLINDVIGWIMGDYYGSTSFDTFTSGKFSNDNAKASALAQMVGKRMIYASETSATKYLDTSAIKTVTGDSLIQARHLRHDPFTYEFKGKIVLTTNHSPQVRDDSEGIWERIVNVEFGRVFSPAEIDNSRMSKLKAEASGILNWLVEGAIAWQQGGLQVPDSIRETVQQWRESEDDLAAFAEDRCAIADGTFCTVADMFEAWKDYCEVDNRPTRWSKMYFTRKFMERFPALVKDARFRPPGGVVGRGGRVNQVTVIRGIKLLSGHVSNLDRPAGAQVAPLRGQASTDEGQ